VASPSLDGNIVRALTLRDLLRDLDALGDAANEQDAADCRFLGGMVRCLGSTSLELPVFPDVSRELDRLLRKPDPDLMKVLELVAREPDLLRRVWTSASSAVYARGVADLDHAVARIGFDQLWRIGMSACLHSPIFRAGRYQSRVERIRARGEVAGNVGAWICGDPRGDTFLAGMLSGAGGLFVLRCAAQSGKLAPRPELVQKVLRKHQSGLGVLMAHAWGLGDQVAAGIGFFCDPDSAPPAHQGFARTTRIAVIATMAAEEARCGRDIGGMRALENYNGLHCDAAATMRYAAREWRGAEHPPPDSDQRAQSA
jgi:HD-like signal output (HDOD) protein